MYTTRAEAEQKISGTTILYDGDPVYISNVGGSDGKVTLEFCKIPFGSNKRQWVDIDDPLLDFKSISSKLGYVDYYSSRGIREALFVSRAPVRTTRQGVDSRVVRIFSFFNDRHSYSWDHILEQESLNSTIKNKYTPASTAIKDLLNSPDEVRSVAISRKCMLAFDKVNPPNLIYRNERVGYTEDGKLLKLAPHKKFLAEELTEMQGFKIA
jgi:hypothetical protein